jgi:hypothetical protein
MGAGNSDELDANIITPSLRGAILAVFFAGMALGGFLFAYKSEPMQIASNDATPAIPFPNGAPLTTLH